MTADEMVKELIDNHEAADAKYKNRIVQVTGKVYGVFDKHEVHLNGRKPIEGDLFHYCVRCGVHRRNRDQVAIVSYLSDGQAIKAIGKCTGVTFERWITIDFCKVTELEPSNVLRVSAEKICADFEMDREAATHKYENRTGLWASNVIVKGEIVELTKDDDFCYAKLAGTNKTRVSIIVHEGDHKGLKIGQIAEYRGVYVWYYPERNEVSLDGAMLLQPVVRDPLP